ncbi:DUF1707 SHOCT-like domain-containing protein [Propionibacteriaceae bacterium Y1923]|uniref:DUF1707 SHOCT-like domain-containing protein n=1 Tax=Aestuariimicrobium sp. Y1814 TaxID=3418742 RepID=UPI003C241DED
MSVPTPPKRIGDAERDEAVAQLQEHHAAGRLDGDEFEERMTRALGAKTIDDLKPLFADLPRPESSPTADALVPAANSTPDDAGSHDGPVLPAGEPWWLSAMRLVGWAIIPVGLVLMILGVSWAVFFAGLFLAPGINAAAEAIARRNRENQKLLQQQNQRKELW